MIKVHHLNESRSQRILWFLEELEAPYEIVPYRRDATTQLAPPELKAVHPLGKSPVLEDGAVKIAESGAIVEYLAATYGGGRFARIPGDADWPAYVEWLHYAEGSAMLPIMLNLYVGRLGDAGAPLHPRIESELANHLGYVSGALGDRAYLMGSDLSGADVNMSFVAEIGRRMGKLDAFPNLAGYIQRIHARPAWTAAIARGGPYSMDG